MSTDIDPEQKERLMQEARDFDFDAWNGGAVTFPSTQRQCARGHEYSTTAAPEWLGGRCPACRAEAGHLERLTAPL